MESMGQRSNNGIVLCRTSNNVPAFSTSNVNHFDSRDFADDSKQSLFLKAFPDLFSLLCPSQ